MLTNKQHNIAAKLFEKKYALWKIKSEFNEGTPTYVIIDAHNALKKKMYKSKTLLFDFY